MKRIVIIGAGLSLRFFSQADPRKMRVLFRVLQEAVRIFL
jgi:hypothetical protein